MHVPQPLSTGRVRHDPKSRRQDQAAGVVVPSFPTPILSKYYETSHNMRMRHLRVVGFDLRFSWFTGLNVINLYGYVPMKCGHVNTISDDLGKIKSNDKS
jgi:hypothetical protein